MESVSLFRIFFADLKKSIRKGKFNVPLQRVFKETLFIIIYNIRISAEYFIYRYILF